MTSITLQVISVFFTPDGILAWNGFPFPPDTCWLWLLTIWARSWLAEGAAIQFGSSLSSAL